MIEHPNLHEFVHGHRLRPVDLLHAMPRGRPTLTEQGVDVPQFLKDNRRLIERLRQKRQG